MKSEQKEESLVELIGKEQERLFFLQLKIQELINEEKADNQPPRTQ